MTTPPAMKDTAVGCWYAMITAVKLPRLSWWDDATSLSYCYNVVNQEQADTVLYCTVVLLQKSAFFHIQSMSMDALLNGPDDINNRARKALNVFYLI